MNQNDVNNITKQCIEELRLLPIKHKSRVVKKNLALWDSELFPLLQDVGLPVYPFLLEKIFKPAGFDVPSVEDKDDFKKAVDNLRGTVSSVRKSMLKKGLLSLPMGAGGSDLVAVHHPVSHVVGGYGPAVAPNPVVGGGSTSPAIQEPVADSVTSEGGVVLADRKFGLNIPSYVVRKNSLIELVDFSMYPEELERLRSEKEGGFTVAWSGVDETLFKEFIDIVLEYSSRQFKDSEKFDFNGLIKSYIKKAFKTSIADEMLEIYSLLIYKLKKQYR